MQDKITAKSWNTPPPVHTCELHVVYKNGYEARFTVKGDSLWGARNAAFRLATVLFEVSASTPVSASLTDYMAPHGYTVALDGEIV